MNRSVLAVHPGPGCAPGWQPPVSWKGLLEWEGVPEVLWLAGPPGRDA